MGVAVEPVQMEVQQLVLLFSLLLPVLLPSPCDYTCRQNGSCEVRYVGLARNGSTKGSCFPSAFGGECSGTPPECRHCNEEVACNPPEGVLTSGTDLTPDASDDNRPPQEYESKEEESGEDDCEYSCTEQNGCAVEYTGPVEGTTVTLVRGACYPEAFGGECFGTPTLCRPCNQVVSCGGSPLRKAIENGQEGPGCAGYNCRLNGDQEGTEKDEYALKIDIRQGEVSEVIPKEENAEGSEDSTQAGSIDKPSDAQEAEVSGVVRSVVFTTERAKEITATTTEEVVLCQIVVLTACISLCRGEEEIEKYRDCVQGCTDRWRQHFPQCFKISHNVSKYFLSSPQMPPQQASTGGHCRGLRETTINKELSKHVYWHSFGKHSNVK